MKKSVAILFILVFSIKGFCCLNEYAVDAHGHQHIIDDGLNINFFDESAIKMRLKSIEEDLNKEYNFQTHSDYAVNLLKLGCTYDALKIFEALHKKHPKEYSIAANLGTAYELAGKNKLALKYIKLGIKLNPDSHYGSEWFHVRILEAKLKNLSADEIKKTDILKLNSFKKKDSYSTIFEVLYQLEERTPFTPLGDVLYAKVLKETAEYASNNLSLEIGNLLYGMTEIYYPKWLIEIRSITNKNIRLQHKYKDKGGEGKSIHYVDFVALESHYLLRGNYDYKWFTVQ